MKLAEFFEAVRGTSDAMPVVARSDPSMRRIPYIRPPYTSKRAPNNHHDTISKKAVTVSEDENHDLTSSDGVRSRPSPTRVEREAVEGVNNSDTDVDAADPDEALPMTNPDPLRFDLPQPVTRKACVLVTSATMNRSKRSPKAQRRPGSGVKSANRVQHREKSSTIMAEEPSTFRGHR
ncbi:hypothetical protein AYO20_08409 [Fonsecaea nubica]|uniref:Uncharacterized protein n=1 Tax=Fonsecaea nubica TaxID=856822 RepID=A0A178CMN2_9EURO|nr:hypothetical protein AYO20_08409 [Fonsecaea nubica]OAL31078.1 hypothetical protein AYO20_08409 [Fonsecaea nubica]